MESIFFQNLKKCSGKLIEPLWLKAGHVLEVRFWQQDTMVEVDLYLPEADMDAWKEIPSIKFRVSGLTLRDYTPAGWNTGSRTCTLLIDVSHSGVGSNWAKHLERNDIIHYMKIETTHHAPDAASLIVGLGDTSSLGHLLGLQQLVYPATRFIGAVFSRHEGFSSEFKNYFDSPIEFVLSDQGEGPESLDNWVKMRCFCNAHTRFYITGNSHLVSSLRQKLKLLGYSPKHIKVKGFWS